MIYGIYFAGSPDEFGDSVVYLFHNIICIALLISIVHGSGDEAYVYAFIMLLTMYLNLGTGMRVMVVVVCV